MGKYFSIDEMIKSTTASSKNIDNTPNEEQKKHIYELIDVLDMLREGWTELCEENKWGTASIRVNSGFRSDALNKAVGGSKTSSHKTGYAADIEPVNNRMKEFQEFVPNFCKEHNIPFDQIIKEKPKNGIASWLHFGLFNARGEQRKQVFWLN